MKVERVHFDKKFLVAECQTNTKGGPFSIPRLLQTKKFGLVGDSNTHTPASQTSPQGQEIRVGL